MKRATRAMLDDPYRVGNLIELPEIGELMITGDVHGNLPNFERIVEIADLDNNPGRHLILQEFVHALETSLGRDLSYRALELQAELKCQYPDRVHILLGNHELSEFQGRKVYKDGKMLNKLFRRGVNSAYASEASQVIAAYRKYFRSLPLGARTTSGLMLTHSTPEGRHVHRYDLAFFRQVPNLYDVVQKGLVEELVWGRDYEPEVADAWAEQVDCEVMVVGHTPCDHGYQVPNHRHVIIDSKDDYGAYILLRLDRRYTQRELVDRIHTLWQA